MKPAFSYLLAVALSIVAGCSLESGGENVSLNWLTSYEQAKTQAKAEGKLVLMDFTGSDWCGWCIRLKREVFSTQRFKDYADTNLVLLEVDFPRSKAQSTELKQANQALQQQYQIEGYPTIIVLNPEGRKVGTLGYQPGGPKAFIAELEKLNGK